MGEQPSRSDLGTITDGMGKEGQTDKSLHDLVDIIHFTEKVSTKIHGLLDEVEIFRKVKEESAKSKKYVVTILLLTDDDSKLRIAESSMSSQRIKKAEKLTGLKLKEYAIDLNKSAVYSQIIREGKTVQVSIGDVVKELLPKPVAYLLSKMLGYEKKQSIMAPLKRRGKIIGVIAMTSTELVEYFIPSVRNLAQHISTALELSDEYAERRRMEEALSESEKQYRTIFETMSDVYYRTDLEGNLVSVSPSGLKLFGYEDAEEVLGMNLAENFYSNPKDREIFMKELTKHGKVTNYEVSLKREDRTQIIGEVSSHLVYDENGEPVAVEGIFRDISERKHAEELLRLSEEKYRSLMENLNVGVFRVAPDGDGQFIDVNQAYTEILGYDKKQDVLKLKVSDTYFDIDDRRKLREKLLQQGFLKNEEVTLKRKDGTPIIVSDTGKALYDADGKLLYFDGVIEDITERKQIEEELLKYRLHLEELVEERTEELKNTNQHLQMEIAERKSIEESLAAEKERLAVTLRSIGDGVITAGTDGIIVLINKVAESLTGWTQEEAVGSPLHEVFNIISEKTRESCENPVDRVLREGAVVGLGNNTVLIARDGTERVIADSGAPIRDRMSEIIGVVLVFRDITEKRRLEQDMMRTQKLESISILAGGIAHDFNNILTAILSNANLARMYTEDAKIIEKLAQIEKASSQAKDLTQQLLTFSKGGAPVRKTTSISGLIRDSASFALRGSNVRCHFYIPADLWFVDVDEGQISQVINNLIINADQAMPEGGIVRVQAENVYVEEGVLPVNEGQYVKISITDQGIGIPEKYLQKIFDPYFTTKQRGSGLGLSTSYSIIKHHDGYIDVESETGAGTTFHMYLPASERREEKEEKKRGEPVLGQGKILLMDDEAFVRDAASEILQYLGYTVEVAEDGKEAIDLYKKALEDTPFDAIIMDLTIAGGMGGKEAIQTLQEFDPEVKAIVSSGYSTDPVMADYRKYGFRGVVTKPYSIEELSITLHRVLTEERTAE